jgi:hypothetical protein
LAPSFSVPPVLSDALTMEVTAALKLLPEDAEADELLPPPLLPPQAASPRAATAPTAAIVVARRVIAMD